MNEYSKSKNIETIEKLRLRNNVNKVLEKFLNGKKRDLYGNSFIEHAKNVRRLVSIATKYSREEYILTASSLHDILAETIYSKDVVSY